MLYNTLKYSFCLVLLLLNVAVYAQEEGEGCDLPPPDVITLNDVGPDYVDVSWTPVPGAMAYDIVLVDLSDNSIYYSERLDVTSVYISGVPITNDMVLAIATVCENNEPGSFRTGPPLGPVTFGWDELVVRLEGQNQHDPVTGQAYTFRHRCDQIMNLTGSIQWLANTNKGTLLINPFGSPNLNGSSSPVRIPVLVEAIEKNASRLVQFYMVLTSDLNSPWTQHGVKLGTLPAVSRATTLGQLDQVLDGVNNTPVFGIKRTAGNLFEFEFYSTNYEAFSFELQHCVQESLEAVGEGDHGLRSFTTDNQPDRLVLNAQQEVEEGVEKATSKLQIVTNPVRNQLHFYAPQGGTARIFDLGGRSYDTELKVSRGVNDLTVDHLPAGLYLLRYQVEGAPSQVVRFMKL